MKWLWVLLLLPATDSFATSCSATIETRTGELRVLAIPKSGSLSPIEYSLLDTNGKRVYTSNDGRFPSVLYGSYTIQLSGSLVFERAPSITVAQPYSSARVVFSHRFVCDPVPERTLSGQVKGLPSLSGLWVKAVSARGDYSREYELGPNGHFGFSAIPDSSLILLVLRGDEVLATTTVRDFSQPIKITLPAAGGF